MRKIEIACSVIVMLGIILILLAFPGGNISLVLGIGILALAYQFVSFAILNRIPIRKIFKKESYAGITTKRILASIFIGLALSAACYGILFRLMFWPGAGVMLTNAIAMCVAIIAVLIATHLKHQNLFYRDNVIRTSVFFFICLFLMSVPTASIVKFKHRNDPEYCQALLDVIQNPDNAEYQKRLEEIKNRGQIPTNKSKK